MFSIKTHRDKFAKGGFFKSNPLLRVFYFGITLFLFPMSSRADFTYPNCKTLVEANFRLDTLAMNKTDNSLREPLKMAFDMDAQGNVDVYFVQRRGLVRRYNGLSKSVDNIGDFTDLVLPYVEGDGGSDGVTGIALDPNFKNNHWVYLHFGLGTEWRVSRFTLKAKTLDVTTEKNLIRIVTNGTTAHTAGALAFDWEGNLWIGTAQNYVDPSSINTNDLRGKILRIKPKLISDVEVITDWGPGKTYEIPKGNLFPQEDPANVGKTKPEIYVMGARNPYTITLDSVTKAVTWGDIGPDEGGATEEDNYTTIPGNFGYPYWAGDNINRGKGGIDPAAPIFAYKNGTGLTNLPTARPAAYAYNRDAAITGPVYRYNVNIHNTEKMPPHLNGLWFISDFNKGWVKAAILDGTGKVTGIPQPIFANFQKTIEHPLDFQVGPDGAFYIVNYQTHLSSWRHFDIGSGLVKITYVGETCSPIGARINTPVKPKFSQSNIQIQNNIIAVDFAEHYSLVVSNLNGQKITRHEGMGHLEYSLKELKTGVYFLSVFAQSGSITHKFIKK